MKPFDRYHQDFPNEYKPLQAKNVIAVSIGHCQPIELAMITFLRELGICANEEYDFGQVSPEVKEKMWGKHVFYYLAEKK